jgi:hypothetical protein
VKALLVPGSQDDGKDKGGKDKDKAKPAPRR